MQLHALDYVLWGAVLCVQGGLVTLLYRRGLFREYRYFFYYNVLQVASDLFLLPIQRLSYKVYFFAYWIVIAVTIVLTFALVDELFGLTFREYAALRDLGAHIFRWGILLVALAASITAFTVSDGHKPGNWLMEAILTGDRAAQLMLLLLTILLLSGARFLHLSWRSQLVGFTAGVLLFTLSKVVVDTIVLGISGSAAAIRRVDTVAYLASCTLWAVYARYGESLPKAAVRPSAEGDGDGDKRPLMDSLNDIVERSLRHTQTPS
jgi:hypothetical protein